MQGHGHRTALAPADWPGKRMQRESPGRVAAGLDAWAFTQAVR